jgi:nucleoside 2-deoxyribosyltransferase
MNEKIKVYLSASINNALNNEFICSHLNSNDFEVYLPQTITPNQLNHENFPLDAYQGCLDMMNKSDIGLLLLDSYGRDCAWEAGWYTSNDNKKLVAFVESSSHFMRDWMIKGGIDIFITTNPRIYSYALNDPILKNKKIICINNVEDLGIEIKKAL